MASHARENFRIIVLHAYVTSVIKERQKMHHYLRLSILNDRCRVAPPKNKSSTSGNYYSKTTQHRGTVNISKESSISWLFNDMLTNIEWLPELLYESVFQNPWNQLNHPLVRTTCTRKSIGHRVNLELEEEMNSLWRMPSKSEPP